MDMLLQNVRRTFRLMAAQKAFTAAALLTLAVSIGATTAISSVVHGVLLRPLPYPAADRLVSLSEERPGGPPMRGPIVTNYTFHAWKDAPRMLDGIAAWNSRAYTVTGAADAERLRGAAVTPGLFGLLGVTPAVGRFMAPGDETPGAAPVVVLGYRLWQGRFGGDASAVGQTMMLDGQLHTIVGVARPDFYFPDREARLWTPFAVPPRATNPNEIRVSVFSALGRLAPGATPEQAAAEGTAVASHSGLPALLGGPGARGPRGPRDPQAQDVQVRADTLVGSLTAQVRPALLVLSVGVIFVLLIGCANVANLFLSRGVARERELAVRAAMGAGRGRLVTELLTESLVLALTGGALGLALGWALTRAMPLVAPADFPRLDDIRIDTVTVSVALAASIAAGLLSGLVPALRASRVDLVPALRDGAGASSGGRIARLRAGLLIVEAALAVMLLVGAGLLVRSFVQLVQVDAGYTTDNVLTAQVFLPGGGRGEPQTVAFTRTLLERLRAGPDVEAAGAGNMAPLGGAMALAAFDLPGMTDEQGQPLVARALAYTVTPGYAEALGLRLRAGRFLTAADRTSAVQAVVVNDAFVDAYLADGRPAVGRRFDGALALRATSEGEPAVTSEIVGVVGNVLLGGLDAEPQPEMYSVIREDSIMRNSVFLLVRTEGDPVAIVPTLRDLTRQLEPAAALDAVSPLAARVAASVGQPRFAAALLAGFAALALVLAAIGLYGVLSYNVTRRQREIGVRVALGASRADILRLVVRQGLGVTTAGLVLGIGGAMALTRLMQQMLFGVAPLDWVSFAAAPAVLLVVALVACLVPARRAAATDPAEALRWE